MVATYNSGGPGTSAAGDVQCLHVVQASWTCHSQLGGEVELYSRVMTVSLDISYCYIPCSLSVCWVSLPFLIVLVGCWLICFGGV